MKNILLILVLILVSCDRSFQAPEPEELIEQSKMEDILFDIELLKASKSKNYRILKDNNMQVDVYIYEKYNLDSITLRENIAYYASSSFKKYKEIENNVKLRFISEKEKIEVEIKVLDSLKKIEDSLNPYPRKRLKKKEIDSAK